jgi:hypothetical protein
MDRRDLNAQSGFREGGRIFSLVFMGPPGAMFEIVPKLDRSEARFAGHDNRSSGITIHERAGID